MGRSQALTPIFRDRQELAAAATLARKSRRRSPSSRFLIVLCSPAAAKSRWTNAEIEPSSAATRRLRPGRDRRRRAVRHEIPGREDEECFRQRSGINSTGGAGRPPAGRADRRRPSRRQGRPADRLPQDRRRHARRRPGRARPARSDSAATGASMRSPPLRSRHGVTSGWPRPPSRPATGPRPAARG